MGREVEWGSRWNICTPVWIHTMYGKTNIVAINSIKIQINLYKKFSKNPLNLILEGVLYFMIEAKCLCFRVQGR